MYFDRRLWALTRGLRGRMMAGVVLGLVALAAGIARFAFLGEMLALAFRGAPLRDQAAPAAAACAAIVLRAVLDDTRTRLAHGTASRVQEALRARLHERIVALGPAWFGAERTGGVMLAVVDGVEQLQAFFGQFVPQLAIAVAAPFAIFGFVAVWDVPVACVLLGAALLALVGPMAVSVRDRRSSLARARAFKAFGEEFLDAVQGLPTLKAFGQSGAYHERLAVKARALSEQTFAVLGWSVATRGVVDLGTALGAALALTLGAWRVVHGEMTFPALLVVLMAGTEIFRPLRDLRAVLHQGLLGHSAALGIRSLLDAEPAPSVRGSASAAALPPAIAFEAVRFAYPGARAAAHAGLSFAVAPGERVGIVGPSGAGKSSIVRLLLGEHVAQSGVVRLGGADLRSLDPASLRARIAVVPQDATLFHGSVEENLRLGKRDASRAELEAAARAANAHEFIAALPQGYGTPVGERGARLSGGQRQRIAIARALLRDAPVLILDEALSSLDAGNEAAIQGALNRLMRGRTTLILAHRLSSVIDADRILVLDKGRVVESGTHAQLLALGGLYARLMQPQLGGSPSRTEVASTLLGSALIEPDPMPEPGLSDPDARSHGSPESTPTESWRATLGSLLGFIRPWRGRLLLTVALGVLRVAAFIGVGALGALLVARVRNGLMPTPLVATLLLAAPVAAGAHWLKSFLAHDMAYRLLAAMRIALFATLDRLAPAYLLRRRAGDIVSLATQDIETVEYFYAHTVAPAVVAVLVPVSVLALLALLSWPLALVLLPFLLYALLAPLRGRARIDRLGSEARAALGGLGAHLAETIQGLSELLAFGATEARGNAFTGLARSAGVARRALLADLSRQAAILEAVTALGGLAVAATGAALVRDGGLSPGLLPLLVLAAVAAFLPVSEIAGVSRQLADTVASTRRLRAVQREPVAIADGPLSPPLPSGGSELRFDDVRFTYPGRHRPALHGVSFAVRPGGTVALVGPSGAGKSTVANLLLRFWDADAGSVSLDGVDLRLWRLDALRGRVALVAQDAFLFNDTLEANIRLARPDASHDDLTRAVEQAALGDWVASLPDGLATRVGERGVQLSGGQRQRVAIARAFLKDAPILVLDEATSNLDTISEAQVRAALDRLKCARTTLVIAHRLSTIRDADCILVLQRGRVVESGTEASLRRAGGAYARLTARQDGHDLARFS